MNYSEAIDAFVRQLNREFGSDCFDWIDAPDQKQGLDDVDPEHINPTAFEVDVGLSTTGLSLEEVDALHDQLAEFAAKKKVSVDLTSASENTCVYTFSLHSWFIRAENPVDGLNR